MPLRRSATDQGLAFDYKEDSVVISGHLVTRFVDVLRKLCSVLINYESSRGPGTAFLFALTLVGLLCGPEKRKAVSDTMAFPEGTGW